MPDPINISISSPLQGLIDAGRAVLQAFLDYSIKYRETMSAAARDGQDRILAQMYWDVRALEEKAGIVGPPLEWGASGVVPKP